MIKVAVAQIHYKPCYISGSSDYLIEPFGNNETSISALSFSGDEKIFQKCKNAYLTWLKAKVISIINYCVEKRVDFLALPEYSIPAELLVDIQRAIKSSSLIVIAGTHIVSTRSITLPDKYPLQRDLVNSAICPVISAEGIIGYSVKKNASKWEIGLNTPVDKGSQIIQTEKCSLVIEICIEALASGQIVTDDKCILIVPSYSPSTTPFYNVAQLTRYNEVPTLYVNAGTIGGSSVFASFSEHDPNMFVDGDHSEFIPPNEECIIIADINPEEMYKVSGSVKPHAGAILDSFVNLYYRKDETDNRLVGLINSIINNGVESLHSIELPSGIDSITAKKLNWINKRHRMGLLSQEELISTLRFISINQPSYDAFITTQANELLKSLCGNFDKIRVDPSALSNLSILSSLLDKKNKAPSIDEDEYSNDDNLFAGRSDEIGKVNNFFDSSSPVLICQGLRGIGKSKLVRLIKPRIIPENSVYNLCYLYLTTGSGYDYLVDELFYTVGSPINDPSKKEPEEAARLLLSCLSRLNKTCIIIDDFHHLLNRDKSFCDTRTELFFSVIFSEIDGSKSKFIITTNKRLLLPNCESVFLSRLSNEEILWIIRYCCQTENKNISPTIDTNILNAIHGNPLAAVIVAQLIIENKSVPLPKEEDTFKRFEEQFISNLVGELSLSDDEKTALSILSLSESAVELDFFREKYPHLSPSVNALVESFLVESTPQYGTVYLHPIIKDFFRNRIDIADAVLIHKEYAKYIESHHEEELKQRVPNPTLISRAVYHYAGGLDRDKLQAFKGKYIEQLCPIANKLFRQHNYSEALEYYEAIYKALGDTREDILLRMAQCYVYLDRISDGDKFVELAYSKKPRAAYIYAKYAIALAYKYAYAAQAETYAFRAEEIYYENSNTLKWELAEIRFAQAHAIRWNDKKRAAGLYKEACNIDPSNCYYLCTLCRMLLADGFVDKAHEYYIKSMAINPDYRIHAELSAEFEKNGFNKNLQSQDDMEYDAQKYNEELMTV